MRFLFREVFVICVALVPLGQAASRNTGQENHNLAQAILDYANQREGIELVGGPFSLKDYDFMYDNSVARYSVLKEHRRVVPSPRKIELYTSWNLTPWIKERLGKSLWKEDFEQLGSKVFARHERVALFEYLYEITDAADLRKPTCTFVHINPRGSVKRTEAFLKNRLVDILEPDSGYIQLIFRGWYSPAEVDSVYGALDGRHFRLDNEEWKSVIPISQLEPFTARFEREQTFFLLGDEINVRELRGLITSILMTPREDTINAVFISKAQTVLYNPTHKGQSTGSMRATVFYGQPSFDYPVLSIVLERTNPGFRFVEAYVYEPPRGLPLGFEYGYDGESQFTFTPEIPPAELDNIARTVYMSGVKHLDPSNEPATKTRGKDDVKNLLAIAARIREAEDFREITGGFDRPAHAHLVLGRILAAGGADAHVDLERVGDRWLVTGFRRR